MITLFCPECRKAANVDPALFRQRRRCPICEGRLHDVSSVHARVEDSPQPAPSSRRPWWSVLLLLAVGFLGYYWIRLR